MILQGYSPPNSPPRKGDKEQRQLKTGSTGPNMRFDWVSVTIGNGDSPTILNSHMQRHRKMSTRAFSAAAVVGNEGMTRCRNWEFSPFVSHLHLAPGLYTVLFVTISEYIYGQCHDSINLTRKCGMNQIYTSKPTTHKTGFLFSLACVLCKNSI